MKAWYSKVRDTELKDGSVRATYVVTFETDNAELKREVEKYLQGIMDRADRKTESNSEKPNSCDTCRFELYCPEMCEGCCEWDSHYEPKDEVTISKMEQVEDEPQTETQKETQNSNLTFEKQTDCAWK